MSETRVRRKTAMTAPIFNLSGKITGRMELPEEIFGIAQNPVLLSQAVRVYLANQRQGTHMVKTRSQVSGSTKKIYRQKGTGRARHGDLKAPIFIGGGIAHGPKPKDYSLDFPKKMKRKAFFMALSGKQALGQIKFINGLDKIQAKTREMVKILDCLYGSETRGKEKIMLVLSDNVKNIYLAGRNLNNLTIKKANLLNVYEVLNHKYLLMMKDAVLTLKATFLSKEKKEPVTTDGKEQRAGQIKAKEEKTDKNEKTPKAGTKASVKKRTVSRRKKE